MKVSDEFKKMIDVDIKNLRDAISDINNIETLEYAKLELYKELTAKYHPYIPKFSSGLYNYYPKIEFYDEVKGDTLNYNLKQIYNKLMAFKAAGYPSLNYIPDSENRKIEMININENNNLVIMSFDEVRQEVKNMSCLTDIEIKEIISKINVIEEIVKSPESKSEKWGKFKPIIKWIADKSFDVGVTLLPLILKIK